MFRGGGVPFPVCLVVVVVVVVVVGAAPSLAAPPLPYSLTHDEVLLSVVVNQMAILKGLNASTSFFALHGDGANQLREEMEKERQAMNETVVAGMKAMNETVVEGMKNMIYYAVNDTLQRRMAEMDERMSNNTQYVMHKLEAVQNAIDHPQPSEEDLYADHNDTYQSLCDGHKVLHGGDGGLQLDNYSDNMDCSWEVKLPEGSRPVFRWHYFDIQECTLGCNCDYIYVRDADHNKYYKLCGDDPPDGSFFTVMNNKFKVVFHSDGSNTGRGFLLQYRAVKRW